MVIKWLIGMNFKGKLMEFVVVNDLVPLRLRWRRSAGGIGRLFKDVYQLLDREGKSKAGNVNKAAYWL